MNFIKRNRSKALSILSLFIVGCFLFLAAYSEKEKYNKLMWLTCWKELYPTKIKEDSETIQITAHNISCQIIWNSELCGL